MSITAATSPFDPLNAFGARVEPATPRVVIHDPEFDAALDALCDAIRRQQATKLQPGDDGHLADEHAEMADSFEFYNSALVGWFVRRNPVATRESIDTLRRIVHAMSDAYRLTGSGRVE